jgi:hypothetical protein
MIMDKAWGILWHDSDVMPAARIFLQLIADFVVYLGLLIRPRKAIAAENLFLRRQLWPIWSYLCWRGRCRLSLAVCFVGGGVGISPP